jgi:hypothetical protein
MGFGELALLGFWRAGSSAMRLAQSRPQSRPGSYVHKEPTASQSARRSRRLGRTGREPVRAKNLLPAPPKKGASGQVQS